MTDVVMRQEGRDTLSVKELDVVLPSYQPFNGYTSPLDFILAPYKDFRGSGSSNYAGVCEPPHPQEQQQQLPIKEAETELENFHLPTSEEDGEVEDFDDSLLLEFMTSPSWTPPDISSYYPPLCSPPQYSPLTQVYTPDPPGGHFFLPYEKLNDALHAELLICAKIGMHCYYLERGTYFECRLRLTEIAEHNGLLSFLAFDPVRGRFRKFETKVWYAIGNKDCFHVITSRSRTLPPEDEEEEEVKVESVTTENDQEEEKEESEFDTVDELFKCNLPNWLPGDSKLHYYEMKESEVEQAKEWLHFYAELAWYTKMQTNPYNFEYGKPFELRKIIVQTKEVVDSMKNLKLCDAVFYITFGTRCGAVCKGIIRKTRDGRPEHLSLEAKCFF